MNFSNEAFNYLLQLLVLTLDDHDLGVAALDLIFHERVLSLQLFDSEVGNPAECFAYLLILFLLSRGCLFCILARCNKSCGFELIHSLLLFPICLLFSILGTLAQKLSR